MRRWISAMAGLGALVVALGASAAPPSQKVCLAAAEQGQQLRNAGKLLSAREQLLVCQSASCPSIVREDCIKWLGELAEATPTIVVSVKDGAGADVIDAKISVDGRPLANETLGRPIPIDPGAHVVRAARGELESQSQVLVTQGSKQRVVEVVLEAPKPAPIVPSAPPPAPPPPPRVVLTPPPAPPPPLFGPQRYVSLGVAGAGLVSLVAAAGIGAGYNSDVSSLRAGCGRTTSCRQEDVDAIAGQKTAAYVFAGVGGALLVTSAILFATGAPRERGPVARLVPAVGPVAGGALASLGGSF